MGNQSSSIIEPNAHTKSKRAHSLQTAHFRNRTQNLQDQQIKIKLNQDFYLRGPGTQSSTRKHSNGKIRSSRSPMSNKEDQNLFNTYQPSSIQHDFKIKITPFTEIEEALKSQRIDFLNQKNTDQRNTESPYKSLLQTNISNFGKQNQNQMIKDETSKHENLNQSKQSERSKGKKVKFNSEQTDQVIQHQTTQPRQRPQNTTNEEIKKQSAKIDETSNQQELKVIQLDLNIDSDGNIANSNTNNENQGQFKQDLQSKSSLMSNSHSNSTPTRQKERQPKQRSLSRENSRSSHGNRQQNQTSLTQQNEEIKSNKDDLLMSDEDVERLDTDEFAKNDDKIGNRYERFALNKQTENKNKNIEEKNNINNIKLINQNSKYSANKNQKNNVQIFEDSKQEESKLDNAKVKNINPGKNKKQKFNEAPTKAATSQNASMKKYQFLSNQKSLFSDNIQEEEIFMIDNDMSFNSGSMQVKNKTPQNPHSKKQSQDFKINSSQMLTLEKQLLQRKQDQLKKEQMAKNQINQVPKINKLNSNKNTLQQKPNQNSNNPQAIKQIKSYGNSPNNFLTQRKQNNETSKVTSPQNSGLQKIQKKKTNMLGSNGQSPLKFKMDLKSIKNKIETKKDDSKMNVNNLSPSKGLYRDILNQRSQKIFSPLYQPGTSSKHGRNISGFTNNQRLYSPDRSFQTSKNAQNKTFLDSNKRTLLDYKGIPRAFFDIYPKTTKSTLKGFKTQTNDKSSPNKSQLSSDYSHLLDSKSQLRQPSTKKSNKSVISEYFKNHEDLQFFGENDPIEMEGELYRFKPGVDKHFQTRWVQVSNRAFRYYKNQFQSLGNMSRAVVAFPKRAIEDVCKVRIKKDAFLTKKNLDEKETNLFNFMFEVYLREDYEDIYKYRDEEFKADQDERLSRSRSVSQKSLKSVRSKKSMERKDSKLSLFQQLEQNKSRFNSNNSGILSREKSYSMRSGGSPVKSIKSPLSKYEQLVKRNQEEFRESVCYSKISTVMSTQQSYKTNRVVQGHLMSVRDTDLGVQKQSYLEDQNILQREFGEKRQDVRVDALNNVNAWSTRMQDWYNSERRIIFATTSDKLRKKWIKYFKSKAIPNLPSGAPQVVEVSEFRVFTEI